MLYCSTHINFSEMRYTSTCKLLCEKGIHVLLHMNYQNPMLLVSPTPNPPFRITKKIEFTKKKRSWKLGAPIPGKTNTDSFLYLER